LVAHSKKPSEKQREGVYIPFSYDINGSAAIPNIAHNVVVVSRNILKEAEMEQLEQQKDVSWEKKLEVIAKYDAQFCVRAQREGDGERPMKGLYFDKESWQYRDKRELPRVNYLD